MAGAPGLISALKGIFRTFGVPLEISTDGGPEFTSYETENFLKRWGVKHRLSSAYHPRSNGRAEVAVKSMKRLLQDIITVNGDLDSDAYTRAVLQYCNTPDPDNGISPAQILFGRPIRDMLPFKPNSQVFDHNMIKPLWETIWDKRQQTLVNRSDRQLRELNHHTKRLPNLATGDQCRVQNQCGQFPGRWHRTGKIVEAKDHDQYLVKLDGSNRLTLRNFLVHWK